MRFGTPTRTRLCWTCNWTSPLSEDEQTSGADRGIFVGRSVGRNTSPRSLPFRRPPPLSPSPFRLLLILSQFLFYRIFYIWPFSSGLSLFSHIVDMLDMSGPSVITVRKGALRSTLRLHGSVGDCLFMIKPRLGYDRREQISSDFFVTWV